MILNTNRPLCYSCDHQHRARSHLEEETLLKVPKAENDAQLFTSIKELVSHIYYKLKSLIGGKRFWNFRFGFYLLVSFTVSWDVCYEKQFLLLFCCALILSIDCTQMVYHTLLQDQ